MEEPMRVRCLACGARLELPPRTTYATCRKCGSEYLVSRRGGAYALQALAPEELQLTKDVAAVEREGELGCANTALSMLAVVVVLFCVIGGVGQVVFNSRAVCFGAGVIALALVGVGAVVMLRNLERDRRRKDRLLAARTAPTDDAPPPREAAGPVGD
jgi:DNA-directed RNA polymerase subunit RPC12/RpoP